MKKYSSAFRHQLVFNTLIINLLSLVLLTSCGGNNAEKSGTAKNEKVSPLKVYEPRYATGFKIYYYEQYKILEVAGQYQYRLQSHDNERVENIQSDKNLPVIATPLERMACMAYTHWAAADLFGKTGTIFGICDPEYLNDSVIERRIAQQTLTTIATNQTIYLETLLAIEPQLLMVSFFESPAYQKVEEQHIAVVRNGDFLEQHPLGRAEWMVFMAAFFDEEEAALARFDSICQKYHRLTEKISLTTSRPTVFDGLEYNGVWYVSGGKSYMAQFYHDAGADYLFRADEHTASVPLDLEVVYQQGIHADFWRLYLNNGETYEQLATQNEHYQQFKSWKERQIIYCRNVGSDLFGAGVFRPEVILNDFILAFHPTLGEGESVYYKLLNNK